MLDDGPKRCVRVQRRALVANANERLAAECLQKRRGDPRFANPSLTDEEDALTLARFGLAPTVQEQAKLVFPAEQGVKRTVPCVEATMSRSLPKSPSGEFMRIERLLRSGAS